MREILFRGKSTDINKWVYGFYAGETCEYPWSPTIKQANIIQQGSGLWYEVDPKTVGQYTGLTDKNGVKIFEGDIVWFDVGWEEYGGNTFEVVFTNGCFYLGRNPDTVCFLLKAYIEWAEVIGNIYDNPGLLGGDIND